MIVAAGKGEQQCARLLFRHGQALLESGRLPEARRLFKEAILLDRKYADAYEAHAFAAARERAQGIFGKLNDNISSLLSGDERIVVAFLSKAAPEIGMKAGSWEACFGAAMFYVNLHLVKIGAMDYDYTAKAWLEKADKACAGRKAERLMKSENEELRGKI